MNQNRRRRLEELGWKFGSVAEFLGLSEAESALVELHISLAKELRACRKAMGLTQAELASHVGSSQSRVAKMEAGDPSVTLDLLFRTLFSLGVMPKQLSKLMAKIQVPSS